MDEELLLILKNHKIFSALDETALYTLAEKFKKVELVQGETLFFQGDPSDGIYLLVEGKLSAILTLANGEVRIVGHLEPGETVGESGALTHENRSLTIRALLRCILYKLPSHDFIDICKQHPSVMFETLHPLITRSRSLIQILSADPSRKHVIIIAAHKDITLDKFRDTLFAHIEQHPNMLVLEETNFADNKSEEEIKAKIHDIEHQRKIQRILYFLKSPDSNLAKLAFKKADLIYIAAYANSNTHIAKNLFEKIEMRRKHYKPDPELILIHTEGTVLPRKTSAWLNEMNFNLFHHVRINMAKDYLRLLRFIRGKAVGLVLSGGGTRGWAHLGVIKALREAKIPIDIIGGTSVGGIAGACYAIHESFEDAYDRFYKMIEIARGSVNWRSITWPIISLFNAKNYTRALQEGFGHLYIEDFWLPFFCVSCNLASYAEDIHRHGLIWEKTRASSSIPGLIPPMIINGEIHLDGGLLNNLPVDVMRSIVGYKGKIIAVELNSFSPDRHKYSFPPILTFSQALLAKFSKLGKEEYKFPRFTDTFLKGVFMGSNFRARQNGLAANILINLNLSKFRLLHSTRAQADRLIQLGYEETKLQLEAGF